MKISKIDRDVCRVVSAEMKLAIEAVATKYGLALVVRPGSFNSNSFTSKIEFNTVSEEGIANQAISDFEIYAEMYGIKSDMLGKTFKSGNKTMKIVGLNTRNHKNPIELEDNQGKKYKAPANYVMSFFKG
jgi:hypothetical protein